MTTKETNLKAGLADAISDLQSVTSGCGLKATLEVLDISAELKKAVDKRTAQSEKTYRQQLAEAREARFSVIKMELVALIPLGAQIDAAIGQLLYEIKNYSWPAELPITRNPRTGEIDVALWAEQEFGLDQVHARWLIRNWRNRTRNVDTRDYLKTARDLTGGMAAYLH